MIAAFAEILYDVTATFKEYATGTLLVLDLIGTFVFALSGAVVEVKRRLDIFGVLVISFAAASAAGNSRSRPRVSKRNKKNVDEAIKLDLMPALSLRSAPHRAPQQPSNVHSSQGPLIRSLTGIA